MPRSEAGFEFVPRAEAAPPIEVHNNYSRSEQPTSARPHAGVPPTRLLCPGVTSTVESMEPLSQRILRGCWSRGGIGGVESGIQAPNGPSHQAMAIGLIQDDKAAARHIRPSPPHIAPSGLRRAGGASFAWGKTTAPRSVETQSAASPVAAPATERENAAANFLSQPPTDAPFLHAGRLPPPSHALPRLLRHASRPPLRESQSAPRQPGFVRLPLPSCRRLLLG
ncbi:hypothetical protein OsI_01653 [Oryza sativa Indica Group]|uniref:Uncharacterized protein n=1 Tax=Oryza sativa subsp. indica TaxID=39946 RepID=B8A741_ORYSI|nr:hypothetical protein OsI_01653 [Oryza sativa Indica Group]